MPSNQVEALLSCGCGCALNPCQCDGRCNPLTVDTFTSTEIPTTECENPLPITLTVDLSATSSSGDTCFNGSGTITFKTPITGGVNCWEGDITGSCVDCNLNARTWTMRVVLCCSLTVANRYTAVLTPDIPAVIPVNDQDVTASATSCSPFLFEGCIDGIMSGWVVACLTGMMFGPPTQFTNICVQIYEVL